MSNPTHPPAEGERPVYFTRLEGPLPERRTKSPVSRLVDCQDEIHRLQNVLAVLEDAFGSELHCDPRRVSRYGSLGNHLWESLQCLDAEIRDIGVLLRQQQLT